MRRAPIILTVLALLGVCCWLFPPFHIVRLRAAREGQEQAAFNAARYAGEFWTNRLLKALDHAADATVVLDTLKQDTKAARQRYGRSLGLGGDTVFLLQGTGTVVSVGPKGVGVSLRAPDAPPEVLLTTGILFGNTVRDASGLLDMSAFPNSQHFNDISTELNRIVETQVIPDLKAHAARGRTVKFVGCAEVEEDAAAETPLRVIPVRVLFE